MTITLINEVPLDTELITHTYGPCKMRQRPGPRPLLTILLQLQSEDAVEESGMLLLQRVTLRLLIVSSHASKSSRGDLNLHQASVLQASRPTVASKIQFAMGQQGAV